MKPLVFQGLLQDGLKRFQGEVVSLLPIEVSRTGVYDGGVQDDVSTDISSVDPMRKMSYIDVASQLVEGGISVMSACGTVTFANDVV
jgi:hypothetical protein